MPCHPNQHTVVCDGSIEQPNSCRQRAISREPSMRSSGPNHYRVHPFCKYYVCVCVYVYIGVGKVLRSAIAWGLFGILRVPSHRRYRRWSGGRVGAQVKLCAPSCPVAARKAQGR